MIKFFRRPRQQLLTQNKISKYLLYATGEIILVVFGILIALQINNWNENRKLQETKNRVYSIIKTDLQSDIENIDNVFSEMEPRDRIFKKVIDRSMTREDYTTCENCCFILYSFPDLRLNSRGIRLLEDNSTVFDAHKDSLAIEISNFYVQSNTEIDVALEEVVIDYTDNYAFFKKEKTWFGDYINGIKNEELIDYVLTSADYMNRVRSFYRLYYYNYLGHLRAYRENAQIMIEKIDNRLN